MQIKRGIEDGDLVKVWNDRGECVLKVVMVSDDEVLPGVVVTQGLWEDPNGTKQLVVNTLTPDRLSDIGWRSNLFLWKS